MSRHRAVYSYPDIPILLFAKAPELGKVKTRLAKVLDELEILSLYEAMLSHALSLFDKNTLSELQLWISHGTNSDIRMFSALSSGPKINRQAAGDLGVKMGSAIKHVLSLKNSKGAIIIGADCPVMTLSYIEQALSQLQSGVPLVIGPAEDGGYVLIGVDDYYPEIFEGIHWGTKEVLNQTIRKAENAGIRYSCLDTLWDVDRPGDLERLSQLKPRFNWSR